MGCETSIIHISCVSILKLMSEFPQNKADWGDIFSMHAFVLNQNWCIQHDTGFNRHFCLLSAFWPWEPAFNKRSAKCSGRDGSGFPLQENPLSAGKHCQNDLTFSEKECAIAPTSYPGSVKEVAIATFFDDLYYTHAIKSSTVSTYICYNMKHSIKYLSNWNNVLIFLHCIVHF